MIKEVNENNFEEAVAKGIKLVEFYTDWCGYCKMQKTVLEELPNISIVKINADKNPNLTKKYGINGFPAFILLKDGRVLTKFLGYHEKSQIENKLALWANK